MKQKVMRTEQEIVSYVKDYEKSGKSVSGFCKEHNIPMTTFHGWLKKYKTKQNQIDFIPVKIKKEIPEKETTPFPKELLIEVDIFKIHLSEDTSFSLLREVLQVVKQLDVSI